MSKLMIDEMIEHSFMDFHQKGFHYLCLRRTPSWTIKVYFFDGDVSKMPEVVAPHDHRYDFTTRVLQGAVENRTYTDFKTGMGQGVTYQRFDYLTPLNGGNGFTWKGEEQLYLRDSHTYHAGALYRMMFSEIHTIQIREQGTILRLNQFKDEFEVGIPTNTWTLDREPPNLSGLYRKPTADEIIALLNRLPKEI